MSEHPEVSGGRHEDQGFKNAAEYAAFEVVQVQSSELPTKIEKTDIHPGGIAAGETEIILQRHGAYIRDKEDPRAGSLSEESALTEKTAATAYFEAFLGQVPEAERDAVDVLVVSSDTQYAGNGRRSIETAELAQQAAAEVFEAQGISQDHVINSAGRLRGEGGPRPMPKLREPNMLKDSPDFLDFLLEKYGDEGRPGLDFWVAFEEDKEKATREKMGAEGPGDIADRTAFSVRALARYAEAYHKANPGRRLIIWAATHYDTISPYVKREAFGVSNDEQLLVDYGGGITIDIDKDGVAKTEIAGKEYPIALKKS